MTAPARSTRMAPMVMVLAVDLLAAGAALLIAGRTWQTVVAARPRPLADDVVAVSGRTLDPAVTALAVVALVGALAVIATRGAARRLVGAVIALVGGVLAWRALAALGAVSTERARSLVRDARSGVGLDPGQVPRVDVHRLWPVLLFGCALLALAAGVLIAWRGRTWQGLSGRYEAPPPRTTPTMPAAPIGGTASTADPAVRDPADAPDPAVRDPADAPSDATLWAALDRGDDPTARTES